MEWEYPAYFVVIMFAGAFNSKALAICIVASLGLVAFYPSKELASFIFLFFIPAYVIASFR